MDRTSIIVRLILCLSLFLAGQPAHACSESSEASDASVAGQEATIDHADCPHHAPPAEEAEAEEHGIDFGSDCCGLNCRCGCSAPVPGLVLLITPQPGPDSMGIVSTVAAPHPSLSPEQLLRPPKQIS